MIKINKVLELLENDPEMRKRYDELTGVVRKTTPDPTPQQQTHTRSRSSKSKE